MKMGALEKENKELKHQVKIDITKTCPFKYTENFTTKNENFQIKNLLFFIFLLKT